MYHQEYAAPHLICCLTPPPPSHLPTLSLHDALPISHIKALTRDGKEIERFRVSKVLAFRGLTRTEIDEAEAGEDRKSTRLNSSHVAISYAVFCLKKKKRKEGKGND